MNLTRQFRLVQVLSVSLVLACLLSLGATQPNFLKSWTATKAFTTTPSSTTRFLSSTTQSNADSTPVREIPLASNASEPLGMTMDKQGNIWFAENNPPAIVKYNPALGNFTSYSIPSTGESMIWFMIFDTSGNLWFSNALQPYLWSFSPTTHQFLNFSTGGQYVYPFSIAYDNTTQEIWFTSIYTDQIGYFKLSGTEASLGQLVNMVGPSSGATSGPKYGPSGLAFDSQGDLFVSNTFAPDIVQYSVTQQKFLHFWNLPVGSQPVGIAVDSSNNRLWFANHGTSLFGYLNLANGKVTEYATSLFSYLDDNITLPYWIQVSPSGQVWFDEHISYKIARFDPSTGLLTEFQVPTFQAAPLRFVLDDKRGVVWFTEFQGGKLGEVNQNQTCNCRVSLSSSLISLTGGSATLYMKYQNTSGAGLANSALPLISGSVTASGYPNSNLSISSSIVNSSYYRISIANVGLLTPGNYTLTFCGDPNNSYNDTNSPPVRQCATAALNDISSASQPIFGFQDLVIAGAVVLVALGISLFFVKRWRQS
jgi:streptogramin lyase